MSERRRKRKSRRDQLRNSALSELGSTGLELLSHGKVRVGKRMSQEDRERTQARVGLASNVLGLTAAGVATGAALKNPALRRPSKAEPGPVSGRVLRVANKGRLGRVGRVLRSPRGRAALIAGGAGSALGLQLANLGGDVVANRVLSREAGMSKAEFSFITKSDEVPVTGHGVNIAKSERFTDAEHKWYDEQTDKARRLTGRDWAIQGGVSGAVGGGVVGGYGGTLAGALASRKPSRMRFSNKLMTAGMIGGALAGAIGGGVAGANKGRRLGNKRAKRFMEDPQVKYQILSLRREGIRREKAVSYKKSEVKKRNFNAEADRQRRLGLYAGAGIGGGLVAGDAARKVVLANSKKIKDLYDIPDKRIANKRVYRLPKRRLDRVGLAALAAGSVLGVGGGLAAYKRGIDERNNPWG